jgi:hypothetical protein
MAAILRAADAIAKLRPFNKVIEFTFQIFVVYLARPEREELNCIFGKIVA